ncbi:hypothetical protein GUG48_12185, partial [Xanthomonas citri pv. citri]|nr:hypothetical protein [Xanthomonas citri pv. citri]
MLTQAWRKIDWRKQDSTRSIVKYLPEKNLKIAGSITNLNKKPLADANAVLMFPNNKMLVANVDTDENGKFSFEDVYLE